MISFSHPHIALANEKDIPAICDLLNSAYRGERSQKGWTSESHLIAGGTRTTTDILRQLMQTDGSVFLKFINDKQEIIGCVNLQQQESKLYLGMLSVSPELQGGGVGNHLLKAAEEYARHIQCNSIYMSVIDVRAELINWYMRHGYTDTGERKPFIEDGTAGHHLQPLTFMYLEKQLN